MGERACKRVQEHETEREREREREKTELNPAHKPQTSADVEGGEVRQKVVRLPPGKVTSNRHT